MRISDWSSDVCSSRSRQLSRGQSRAVAADGAAAVREDIGGAGAGAERVVRRGGTARRSGYGAGAGGGPDGAVARGDGGRLADRRGEDGAAGGRITDWVSEKTQGHE